MLDEKMLKIMGSVDVGGGHGTCPTVEVISAESPTGRKTINKVDMQPMDRLYVEK